jgi:hypothetical protein
MLDCGRVVALSTLQVVCRRETAQTRLVVVVFVMLISYQPFSCHRLSCPSSAQLG